MKLTTTIIAAVGLIGAAAQAQTAGVDQVPKPSAASAPAPADAPQHRQRVADLAYVLGEAHALHRVCAGPEDNTWRGRMSRLLQVEAPDSAYRARLMERFNAGFVAQTAQFPACTAKTAAAERTVASKGRGLARQIAIGEAP